MKTFESEMWMVNLQKGTEALHLLASVQGLC